MTSARPPSSAHPERSRCTAAAESKGNGFTLLEVMVALAILAAALLGVTQLASAALRNHERAVRLEIATLLARGKLAALQDTYQKDGFKDFDQEDEGTFEDEGHPEIRWRAEARKPRIELGPEQILAVLTGAKGDDADSLDLAKLLGGKAQSADDAASGITTLFPGAAALAGGLRAQATQIGEQIKKALREVRLTVSWRDGTKEESFTVVTHLVVYAGGTTQ